jgi:hypothetical protein
VQTAAEGSPVITPPPDTPIYTCDRQPLSPILEDENLGKLDNLGDNDLVRKSTKSKQAPRHVNGQSYYYLYLIFSEIACLMMTTVMTTMTKGLICSYFNFFNILQLYAKNIPKAAA